MTRNHSIDILKAIAAFMVVIIHCHCQYTGLISPILRSAVCLFFAISGYCINSGCIRTRLTKSFHRVFVILLWSSLLYGVLFIHKYNKGDYNFNLWESVIDFFIYNNHPFIYHLWYLITYLYVLVIMWFVTHYKKWRIMYVFIPFLFLFNPALGRYSELLFGIPLGLKYIMPFVFTGLPFFLCGMYIKDKEEILLSKKYSYYILFSISLISVFVEVCLLDNAGGDLYLSILPMVFSAIIITISFKCNRNFVARIGEKDSLNIYILHPLTIDVMTFLQAHFLSQNFRSWDNVYGYTSPIIIFCFSLLLSRLVNVMNSYSMKLYNRL